MSKKFDTLAAKISDEYQKKGVSKEKADLWGRETAGKVYQEQKGASGEETESTTEPETEA